MKNGDKATEQRTETKDSDKSEVVEGYEMEEEKQEREKNIKTSNMSWVTIAIILICIGLFYYGWRKGKKQC